MVNKNSMMVSRDNPNEIIIQDNIDYSNNTGNMLMQRKDVVMQDNTVQEKKIMSSEDVQAPEKKIIQTNQSASNQSNTQLNVQQTQKQAPQSMQDMQDKVKQQSASITAKITQAKQNNTASQVQSKPAAPQPQQKPVTTTAANVANVPANINIRTENSIDDLVRQYMTVIKTHFDIDLNASICFENMRKFCEIKSKAIDSNLYFLENTYRISTLIYLASNFPIIFVSTMLSDANRKSVLDMVSKEVEIGTKNKEELQTIRLKRWSEKFATGMQINDSMTVTPGVTEIAMPLKIKILAEFNNTCSKLKKFNKEMTGLVAKCDENTLNDLVFIYSNWWYFLQCFENVPVMREHIMELADKVRSNLKI